MNGDGNEIWLKGEIEEWKNQGIIDDYQAKKILSIYGLAEIPLEITSPIGEDKSVKLITVISALGAILVGVGAILFVGSNWNKLSDFLKLTILFGTTFVTYFAGWKLKYDTKSATTAELLQLYGKILEELKTRKVIRTANSPVGDYAEWLVANKFGLKLMENSKKGYDAEDSEGIKYQIKFK